MFLMKNLCQIKTDRSGTVLSMNSSVDSSKFIDTNPVIKTYSFKKNKNFPNSMLPLLVYKNVCLVGKQQKKAAAALQKQFNKHNWKNAWTNGIYNFHHYHSNTHECLGIAAGKAWVIFGGPGGRKITLNTGDVVIIPAGLTHKCSRSSPDFVCVGAYPGGKQYDIKLGTAEEIEKSTARIAKLAIPRQDPVFGKEGFLKSFWQ